MTKEPGSGCCCPAEAELLPYLAPDDSQEFVQMADLFVNLPSDDNQGLQQRLPLHSQVLSRSCAAVAQMLASLADGRSGAACSPAQPLDISTFFAGSSRPAALLFLACAYSPDAAPARLQAALTGQGGLPAVTGMLGLAHRLDAGRLLLAALEWAQEQRDEVYGTDPTLWFSTAAALQLDGLRGRLAAWAVSHLSQGPDAAAGLLQRLDFTVLPLDTAAMLLDGLAAAALNPPSAAAYEHWGGPGSLCRHAAAAGAAAAAAQEAEAAQPAEGLDALLEAQQQQAAEDWDEGWDEAEADADDVEWEDDGLPALLDDGADPAEGPLDGLLPGLLEGVQLEEDAEGEAAVAAAQGWPEEFETWEQQQSAGALAVEQGLEADEGGWGDEFEGWEQQQEQQVAEQAAEGAADDAARGQQPADHGGAGDAAGPAAGSGATDEGVPAGVSRNTAH